MAIEYPANMSKTVHSYYKTCKTRIERSEIPYSVKVNRDTRITSELIDWCTENCVSPWGWYFDLKLGTFMGFANIEEKTLFCLVNDYD